MKELLLNGVDGLLTDDVSLLSMIMKEITGQNYYEKALRLIEAKS